MTTRVVVEPVYPLLIGIEEKDAATGEWHKVNEEKVPVSSKSWETHIYSTRRITIQEDN